MMKGDFEVYLDQNERTIYGDKQFWEVEVSGCIVVSVLEAANEANARISADVKEP